MNRSFVYDTLLPSSTPSRQLQKASCCVPKCHGMWIHIDDIKQFETMMLSQHGLVLVHIAPLHYMKFVAVVPI